MVPFLLSPGEARAVYIGLLLLGQFRLAARLRQARMNYANNDRRWKNGARN
jgi:hypothetical protein